MGGMKSVLLTLLALLLSQFACFDGGILFLIKQKLLQQFLNLAFIVFWAIIDSILSLHKPLLGKTPNCPYPENVAFSMSVWILFSSLRLKEIKMNVDQ